MVSITGIGAALSSLKAASDITKAMVGLRDAEVFRMKAIELQGIIMEAQASAIDAREAHSTQVERISALEAEVARLKAWDADKQRYELKPLGQGIFAYTVKPDAQGSEPAHSICPDCYQRGVKFILQQVTRDSGMAVVQICQQCGWEAYIHGSWQPDHGATKSSSKRPR